MSTTRSTPLTEELNDSVREKSEPSFEHESELILLCASVDQDVEQSRRISDILKRSLDWGYLFGIAMRNGLLPLLSWTLLQKHREAVPKEVADKLGDFLAGHTKNNMLLTFKLIECLEMLSKNDIHALAFKGTTLAHQAYGNLSLRHYGDLDILVQPRHFDKAVNILSESGYVAAVHSSWLKRKSRFFTREKDIRLLSKDGQVCIELHWKLSGSHFALPVEINQLWKRFEIMELGGARLNALAFHDLFVYLCLHGSRHGWEKFSWVCDLHELIRSTERSGTKIDWLGVRNHARNHGCEKVVELGLFLVHDFFELRPHYPEFERTQGCEAFQKMAKALKVSAFSVVGSHNEIGDWYLYHLALKERRSDRMRLRLIYLVRYLKIAFTPTETDEEVFRLPAFFYPLYFILRPLRLFVKSGRSRQSRGKGKDELSARKRP